MEPVVTPDAETYRLFTTEVYPASQKIDGWLTRDEALALFFLARSLPQHSVIVEIGSHMGKSTSILARGLAHGGLVFAVDPWDARGTEDGIKWYGKDARLQQFKNNMQGLDKVVPLRGMSHHVVENFTEPVIDLLFIDGDHRVEGVTRDFDLWSPLVRPGGTLALHDVFLPGDLVTPGYEAGPAQMVQQRILGNPRWTEGLRQQSLYITRRVS